MRASACLDTTGSHPISRALAMARSRSSAPRSGPDGATSATRAPGASGGGARRARDATVMRVVRDGCDRTRKKSVPLIFAGSRNVGAPVGPVNYECIALYARFRRHGTRVAPFHDPKGGAPAPRSKHVTQYGGHDHG